MEYIEAYFDDLDRKVAFLEELFRSGRQDEAATLCYVYVDGLGYSLYWPDERSAFNFVRVLCEHGDQPHLALVHPVGLTRWLCRETNSTKFNALGAKLEGHLSSTNRQLFAMSEFSAFLSSRLTPQELTILKKEIWRGTLAYATYEWLRNPFVHRLRVYGGLSFDGTTHRGKSVPTIEFWHLYGALKAIARHARQLSKTSGRFCGHHFSKRALSAS
jgi:hypothetical protein